MFYVLSVLFVFFLCVCIMCFGVYYVCGPSLPEIKLDDDDDDDASS